jgi:DNA uptake protein ComE-like DNA-binding protein
MNIFPIIRFVAGACLSASLALSAPAAEKSRPAKQARQTTDAKIDLNTADLGTLEAVPVIGPDGARAIVAARPFATIDELDRLKGISAERLEQIRSVVTVATSHVPVKLGSPTVDTGARASSRGTESAKPKVNLNTADLKTLEAIPSIGPETARAIMAARPFTSLDELTRIKGLSAERLEQIRAQTTVATPATPLKKPLGQTEHPTDRR